MADDHETHDTRYGSPHQVQSAIAHDNVILAVDRAWCADEGGRVICEILQPNLLAVDSRSSFAADVCLGYGLVGHSIALGARDQVVLVLQERDDDLGAGVVGISDEQHLPVPPAS